MSWPSDRVSPSTASATVAMRVAMRAVAVWNRLDTVEHARLRRTVLRVRAVATKAGNSVPHTCRINIHNIHTCRINIRSTHTLWRTSSRCCLRWE
jgi:hypothetical protein